MILWLDAQLPPSLAAWLAAWLASNYDVGAVAVRDLGLRDAEDRAIFDEARARRDVVIVSKDSGFVDLVGRFGTPPRCSGSPAAICPTNGSSRSSAPCSLTH